MAYEPMLVLVGSLMLVQSAEACSRALARPTEARAHNLGELVAGVQVHCDAVAPGSGLGYGAAVTRTLIVSRDTICSLLEAHASMAAWYYQLSNALRAAGAEVEPPNEQLRLAFIQQIGTHFQDLGEVARSIAHPRPYIPPPAFVPPPGVGADAEPTAGASPEPDTAAASPALLEPATDATATAAPTSGAVPPPPLVDPKKVRYE